MFAQTFPRGGVAVVAPFPLALSSLSSSVFVRRSAPTLLAHAFHTTDEHLAGSCLIMDTGG